jgi:hypothetical protein
MGSAMNSDSHANRDWIASVDREAENAILERVFSKSSLLPPASAEPGAAERSPGSRDELAEEDRARDLVRRTVAALIDCGYRVEPQGSKVGTESAYEEYQRHVKQGDLLGAIDVLAQAPQARARTKWLQAKALVRASPRAAESVLRELETRPELRAELSQEIGPQGVVLEELLGLKARVTKSLWESAVDPELRRVLLDRTRGAYLEAYRQTGGIWTGINAAHFCLLAGDRAEAQRLAAEVARRCEEQAPTYHVLATLAEARLIEGEIEIARELYAQAVATREADVDAQQSTRRDARSILGHLGRDLRELDSVFEIPRVAFLVGHMIDAPDRAKPRFPPHLEGSVASILEAKLEELEIGIGYASAANGSDLLFHEALRRRGGAGHVVLPYGRRQFRSDSVAALDRVEPNGVGAEATTQATDGRAAPPAAAPGNWGERFDALLAAVGENHVVELSPSPLTFGSVSFEYANRVTFGMALLHAQRLDTDLVTIAVYDGAAGDGPGGTASSVAWIRSLGYPVEVIPIGELLGQSAAPAGAEPLRTASGRAVEPHLSLPPTSIRSTSIKAILFADVHNFSKLTEDQNPAFVDHFMQGVAGIAERYVVRSRNTWGDGLFMVFDRIEEAGRFALDLSEFVAETRWDEVGLPFDLGIRIALHAGPVFEATDPVTAQRNFVGAHVTRAARIEPKTPTGEVYASQAFAALAAETRVDSFRTEYVGRIPLAKKYGDLTVYRLFRAGPAA